MSQKTGISGCMSPVASLTWLVQTFIMLAGCRMIPPLNSSRSEAKKQQMFNLEHVSSEQRITFLSKLGIDEVSLVPNTNAVSVTSSSEQLQRAGLVLDLVDTEEEFVIENPGPASSVRALPSNSQIATVLGDIKIGIFTDPPKTDEQPRGIIDINRRKIQINRLTETVYNLKSATQIK